MIYQFPNKINFEIYNMEQECIWEYHNMGGVHMSINKKVLNSISDHSDIKGILFGHNIKFLLGHMNNIFANLKKKVNLVIFDILVNNNVHSLVTN